MAIAPARLLVIVSTFTLFLGIHSVKILDLKVPEVVQLGNQEAVVLDCDYETDDNSGLYVKWFFRNKTQPVYQWIPTKKPQDLGILKGKLDLTYKVSDDAFKAHRALRIINPGTELSGEYTCVVSTFLAEDKKTKSMTVFVPETNFRLTQSKHEEDSVKVTCSADGMFPKPNISISSPARGPLDGVTSITPSGGRYDAVSWVLLRDDLLPSPTEFVCELRIPQANYVVKKEAIYYPGRRSREIVGHSSAVSWYNGSSTASVRNFTTFLLLIPIFFSFFT